MLKSGRTTVSRFCDLAGLLALGMTLAAPPAAASENYCDDPKAANDWHRAAVRFQDNDGFQVLHAIRIGLCQKIKDGSISEEHAIELFERQRQRFIGDGKNQLDEMADELLEEQNKKMLEEFEPLG